MTADWLRYGWPRFWLIRFGNALPQGRFREAIADFLFPDDAEITFT